MMRADMWFWQHAPAEREATPQRVPRGTVRIERLASGCILYRVDFSERPTRQRQSPEPDRS